MHIWAKIFNYLRKVRVKGPEILKLMILTNRDLMLNFQSIRGFSEFILSTFFAFYTFLHLLIFHLKCFKGIFPIATFWRVLLRNPHILILKILIFQWAIHESPYHPTPWFIIIMCLWPSQQQFPILRKNFIDFHLLMDVLRHFILIFQMRNSIGYFLDHLLHQITKVQTIAGHKKGVLVI